MLIRVLLAAPLTEQHRLRELIPPSDVSLVSIDASQSIDARLSGADFDLLIVKRDLMAEDASGQIRAFRSLPERPEVVILTDEENAEDRARLVAAGCLGVLNSQLDDRSLGDALRALIERRHDQATDRLRAERPEEQYSLNDFISDSPAMQLFLSVARKVVRSNTSVLILGETGVGKERLARAIHAEGMRTAGPFIAVNCGAIPESLMESELFGHEEGSFTGATRARKGFFELAHRGTLFLDEIGEMQTHLQVKLLRALDERKVFRVGAEKPIDVDVRMMAATNKDLEVEIESQRFRADLFYRLAVVTLTIPPLRNRREDIAKLVQDYLEHFHVQTGRQITSVSSEAMSAMVRYDWPGNVRELINAMERAFLLGATDEVQLGDLPVRVVRAVQAADSLPLRLAASTPEPLPDGLLQQSLADARKKIVSAFETRYIASLLDATGGRISETAARAGINERSLYDLMKRRGLRKEDYKGSRPGEAPGLPTGF